MAVTLELARPKSVTTNAQNTALSVGTVVEVDTSTEESFFIPVTLASTDPPSFTVASCTTTNASTTVTTTGSFADVRVGDAVTGTGIAADTTVSAKASNTSLTLSANATASGTVTLTFDPPAITPTVYAIKVTHAKSGSAFSVTADLITYDGTLGGTAGTVANATKISSLTPADGQKVEINIDSFLVNARVPRSA